jgi:pimeloyl-ACP methyl ester carboxylesterase
VAANGRRDLAAAAEDVVAIASATGLDRPVVIGHSYGAAVTGEAVGRFPDRFAGAVFLDPPGDLRGLPAEARDEWRAGMTPDRFRVSSRAWFEQILHDARPETRQHVLATLGLTPRETYVASMESILSYDPTVVRRFPGPKLLVTVRTFDGPMSMRAAVPELPNVFIEDTSHWPHLDQPAEVAGIVRRFLSEVDRRRS